MASNFVIYWVGSASSSLFQYPAASVPGYIDCFPDAVSSLGGFSQSACQNRHCTYDTSVPQGYPWCYYPKYGGIR